MINDTNIVHTHTTAHTSRVTSPIQTYHSGTEVSNHQPSAFTFNTYSHVIGNFVLFLFDGLSSFRWRDECDIRSRSDLDCALWLQCGMVMEIRKCIHNDSVGREAERLRHEKLFNRHCCCGVRIAANSVRFCITKNMAENETETIHNSDRLNVVRLTHWDATSFFWIKWRRRKFNWFRSTSSGTALILWVRVDVHGICR